MLDMRLSVNSMCGIIGCKGTFLCVFSIVEKQESESWWGTINGKVEGRGKGKREEDGKNDLV